MPDRPRAADDFATIRARVAELRRGAAQSKPVDIYYHPHPDKIDRYYINAVSERAKAYFLLRYGFTRETKPYGGLDTDSWHHRPPDDFIMEELKPGMTLPDDAWGKRP